MLREEYSKDDQKHVEKRGKLAAFSCLVGSEHNLKSCLDGAK